MAKNSKLSKNTLKKIKRAGLPTPDLGTSRQQFARLQKQWYAKLAKQGFEDIEWVDHNTGLGHDSAFLKGSLSSGKPYHPGRELYYQLATNYLMNCISLKNKPYNKFIWKLHAEGATYDEIEAAVNKKYKNSVSKYTLYYQIKHLAQLCYKWNKTSAEGLLRKRAEDRQEKENSVLADFYAEEYNWMINREFASEEITNAKQKKVKRGKRV